MFEIFRIRLLKDRRIDEEKVRSTFPVPGRLGNQERAACRQGWLRQPSPPVSCWGLPLNVGSLSMGDLMD